MRKFKYFETSSGKTIMTAQVDGYLVADKLLEGVMFNVTVQADGTLKAKVEDDSADYFSQFNENKYLKEVVDMVSTSDDCCTDPVSGEDCNLVTEDGSPVDTRQAVPIKMTKMTGHEMGSTASVPEKVIGKFKTKKEFLGFLAIKGMVRMNHKTAFIDASEFSGMFETERIKITICDDNTINFEEVDSNLIDDGMAKRFIEEIESKKLTKFGEKFVIATYKFEDNKGNRLYLELEHINPIDKLKNIFAEEKKISAKGRSFLDDLLGGTDDLDTNEVESKEEEVIKTPEPVIETKAEAYEREMRASWAKMNQEKINELEDRIGLKSKAIYKHQFDIKSSEKLLSQVTEDIRILNSRLDTLKPNDDPNGYVFYISNEIKSDIEVDDTVKSVVNKVCGVLKLKEDAVLEFIKSSYYKIRISSKEKSDSVNKEIYSKMGQIDPTGEIKPVARFLSQVLHRQVSSTIGPGLDKTDFEYRGEMNWHQLVNRMLKLGFEQSPEFDKECGSNSYFSDSLGKSDESKEEEPQSGDIMIIEDGKARKMNGDTIELGVDSNGDFVATEMDSKK